MQEKQVVFAGCGFLGEVAAGLFFQNGWRVLGLCATAETAARLSTLPFPVLVADISRSLAAPEGWSHPDLVVHCASSGGGDAADYRAVYRNGVKHLLEAFVPSRMIFTGSTSVYDQQNGEEVDETSPTLPQRETAKVLLEAEAHVLNTGGIVARLAGIYGPGRSMFLRKFAEGSAVLEAGGNRFLNLIHRDDAAKGLLRLADPSIPSGIYNVCDDYPPTQKEMYGWISEFLHKPMPPEGPIDLHRKRGLNSKRVSNKKLRSLGWNPDYPSFRDALSSLASSEF